MNYRAWKPGMLLKNRQGFLCRLLAPTWEHFAWVVICGETTPRTYAAPDLSPVESSSPDESLEMTHKTA